MDNRRIYTVTKLNEYIERMFKTDFVLGSVCVSGELKSIRTTDRGDTYFQLKEGNCVLQGVLWADRSGALTFSMEKGQKVIVTGPIRMYKEGGTFSIHAYKIEKEGIGEQAKRFEKLKRELQERGMFAEEYKQTIPFYVRRLGVVTAAGGAAIRDIISTAKERNPYVEIILYPAQVQGERAPLSIVRGIQALDKYGVDVMIVGRGGGSQEDLEAFNTEMVAQAIFDCATPIISAVGHEIDVSISDFVADQRAATPTAAAGLAVRKISDLEGAMEEYQKRLDLLMNNHLLKEKALRDRYEQILTKYSPEHRMGNYRDVYEHEKQRLNMYMDAHIKAAHVRRDRYDQILLQFEPEKRVRKERERLELSADKLHESMERIVTLKRHRLEILCGSLEARSPLERLGGGYVYARNGVGKSLCSVEDVRTGEEIILTLKDGEVVTKVGDIRPAGALVPG